VARACQINQDGICLEHLRDLSVPHAG
jgi:hypothetical protein